MFLDFRAFSSDVFDGIMGLGTEPDSFFGALVEQGLPGKISSSYKICETRSHILLSALSALFSFYLTPKTIGSAELTLGGIDYSKFKEPMVFSTIRPNGAFWTLPSSRIIVNGQTNEVLSQTRDFIFDSATSNLVFPKALTEVCSLFPSQFPSDHAL